MKNGIAFMTVCFLSLYKSARMSVSLSVRVFVGESFVLLEGLNGRRSVRGGRNAHMAETHH